MSSTASNYDLLKLQTGIATALASVVLAGSGVYLGGRNSISAPSSTLVFGIAASTAYCIMMFASSFVEEEQQFWYWIASAWFTWVYARRSVLLGIHQIRI